MSREIKFRAWDEDSSVMYDWEDLIIQKDDDKDHLTLGYKKNLSLTCFDHEQILMQYTGIEDINDVEIYEGDIVVSSKVKGYVDFLIQQNGYAVITKESDCKLTYGSYEIIGNIHERPELLE